MDTLAVNAFRGKKLLFKTSSFLFFKKILYYFLMKIYFTPLISSNSNFLKKYQLIIKKIKTKEHQILSKNNIFSKLPHIYLQKESKTLEKADLIIAELTFSFKKNAFLIKKALFKNIPVLALFYKDFYKENIPKLPAVFLNHPEFYTTSWDEDNLDSVINFNLEYFSEKNKIKGKLIVIDGSNGSGKTTQMELLKRYLKKEKIKFKYISFPRYNTSFHGQIISCYLKGEFGKVNPYLSSLPFALDRLTAKEQMLDWLKNGNLVIAERYVASSLAHQGAKFSGIKKEKFMKWLYEMEYKQHRMPKEDLLIYLYVAPEISDKLISKRSRKKGEKKKRDIEETLNLQKKAVKIYLSLCKKFKHWYKIDCHNSSGKIKSKKEIHQLIISVLKSKKIIV